MLTLTTWQNFFKTWADWFYRTCDTYFNNAGRITCCNFGSSDIACQKIHATNISLEIISETEILLICWVTAKVFKDKQAAALRLAISQKKEKLPT